MIFGYLICCFSQYCTFYKKKSKSVASVPILRNNLGKEKKETSLSSISALQNFGLQGEPMDTVREFSRFPKISFSG